MPASVDLHIQFSLSLAGPCAHTRERATLLITIQPDLQHKAKIYLTKKHTRTQTQARTRPAYRLACFHSNKRSRTCRFGQKKGVLHGFACGSHPLTLTRTKAAPQTSTRTHLDMLMDERAWIDSWDWSNWIWRRVYRREECFRVHTWGLVCFGNGDALCTPLLQSSRVSSETSELKSRNAQQDPGSVMSTI